jgi:hypothetical protein
LVIDENDNNFTVNMSNGSISFLPNSGCCRNKFGILHNFGSKYVYVVGGKDTLQSDNLKTCKKFDINKYEWVDMPDMNK